MKVYLRNLDEGNCCLSFLAGRKGDWAFYPAQTDQAVARANIRGNRCESLISKIIAIVSSFFGFGELVWDQFEHKGSHLFWVDSFKKGIKASFQWGVEKKESESSGTWFLKKLYPKKKAQQ